QLLRVLVGAFGDLQAEVPGLVVQLVDFADLHVDIDDAIEREDPVLVGVGDEQRPGSDQGRDHRVVPAEGVDLEHAVAVPFDTAVHDVIIQTGDAGDGDGGLDALVEGGDPPAVRTATGAAGDADPLGIDFGAALQVVDRADAVP